MVKKLSLAMMLIIGVVLCGLTLAKDQKCSSYSPACDSRGTERPESKQRRRSWTDRISTEQLLTFLKEHESELAERLEKLRKDRSRYFNDQVRALKELYGPVIEQMKEDPKAGKIDLEKIRLRLRIKDAVDEVKNSRPRALDEAKNKLTGHVDKLFDVIVSEQEYDVEQMEQWLKNRDDRRSLSWSEYRSRWDYIEQKKEDIANWRKNKTSIVEQRVEKLLQPHPDFPWGGS